MIEGDEKFVCVEKRIFELHALFFRFQRQRLSRRAGVLLRSKCESRRVWRGTCGACLIALLGHDSNEQCSATLAPPPFYGNNPPETTCNSITAMMHHDKFQFHLKNSLTPLFT
ncbi:hypothetical protein K504DRAFT_129840 [Pleomassaria siparia CBS 279.74]|uniref:Uncharacterized protein n=1 Tax=Pleomassaria siparia CBS 279.74 TaxID=1314801 RepID=A0A6G1KJW3_9PLEO|nr:hypothetical protein K504DRAFT_129840 [Pleomassaria siparia CBS 279.74]